MSVGFILTLIFVVLKLTGHVDWSWFWVVFPSLVEIVVSILVIAFVLITGRKAF